MVGWPDATWVVTCSGGNRVARCRVTSVEAVGVWMSTTIVHGPSIDRFVPRPVHSPFAPPRRGSVEATSGLFGNENCNWTLLALTGAPESKSVTRAPNVFSPTEPGETVRRTFTVVAKSLPATLIWRGADAFCAAAT